MRLTTRGRFAVAAMIDLALREQRGAVALASIGVRQQISLSYLEQLFSNLRQAGLVESTRGPGGGYSLARKPADVTVAEILIAVDKPSAADSRTRHKNDMVTSELWDSLNDRMTQYLQTITLKSLADDQVAKGAVIDDVPARSASGVKPKSTPMKVNAPNSVFALGKMFAMGR
jgi:Rrf2 family iron-sulfur cluster assembly transcriptional regulator